MALKSARSKGWFRMFAPQAMNDGGEGSVARIEIYGEIGWEVQASEFLRQLKGLGAVDEIRLSIHSPGGSVLDGWAVANALAHHPAKVVARVEGWAASMASVIACAADVLEMPENAYLMIHNVSAGGWGDSAELRRIADFADQLQEDIVGFYVGRSKQPEATVREWMAAETIFNGAQALEAGFCDRVLEPVAVAAQAGERLPEALVLAMAADGAEPVEEEGAAVTIDGVPVEEEEAEVTPVVPGAAEEEETEPVKLDGVPVEDIPGAENEGFLGKVIAAFRGGRAPAPNGAELASARAEIANWSAKAAALEARATEAEAALSAAQEALQVMRAQERDLAAVLAETGFSLAAAADLPAVADDAPAAPTGNILARFQAITDPAARRDFYRAHKQEILRASDEADARTGAAR